MSWLDDTPDIDTVYTAIADLNGQMRGKRMPRATAGKAFKGQAKMPLSALNIDILGQDIEDSPLVFETGDKDGFLRPTARGAVPMPWLGAKAALLPVWMFNDDGSPFDGDPRHALDRVLGRFRDRDWTVSAATELEFYLLEDGTTGAGASPLAERMELGSEILGLQALEARHAFFDDLYAGCAEMGIAADAASSEAAPGQFEINLMHGDAMKTADDTWLFKMLTKGLARQHGVTATFMAKPKPDAAGNGMHVHFSVSDADGRNVFDDGTDAGTDTMRHAVAGLLDAMAASTLIFAPHANSYERLVPHSHAPTGVSWAYENRTASVRIPAGPGAARRIEHRVAGGDINPYLLMTAILGAAMDGIDRRVAPPPPVEGNAYEMELQSLAPDWVAAVDVFEESDTMLEVFPTLLHDNLIRTKRQEVALMNDLSDVERRAIYLDRV